MKSNIESTLPSQAQLRHLFDYDDSVGALIWRPRAESEFDTKRVHGIWNTRFAGKAAGCLGPNGYIRIEIVHRPYYAHRLIWAWNFGEICEGLNIDHADGIRSNNRLKNLKLVPQAMNLRNQGKRSDNTSGFKGVFWYPRDNNWRAIPRVNGESYRLGSFDRLEDAALAVADFYRKNGFTERHIGQANAQEAS